MSKRTERPWVLRTYAEQWSLRVQQVLAYESDLLEYEDLFDGSPVIDAKVAEIVEDARAEMAVVAEMGGVTPKDHGLTEIMDKVVDEIRKAKGLRSESASA